MNNSLPTTESVFFADESYISLEQVMGAKEDIVNAALISTAVTKSPDQYNKFLLSLLKANPPHTSPFEMVEFKWKMNLPLICWWHLVRHRTGSFDLASLRRQTAKAFYIPEVIKRNNSHPEIPNLSIQVFMNEHFEECFRKYEQMLEWGVAKEQARYMLPGFNLYYEGYFKMDMRNLLNFWKQRLDKAAQYEIRQVASITFNQASQFFDFLPEWYENS